MPIRNDAVIEPQRSTLIAPASQPNLLAKAIAGPADLVVMDLEDGVAPARKAQARASVVDALKDCARRRPLGVRINASGSGLALLDLTAIMSPDVPRPDVIVIPKVCSERDVWWVDTTLTELEEGEDTDGPRLHALIEDAKAVQCLSAIAACSPRLESLAFGPGDFAASMGLDINAIGNGETSLYPPDVWHSVRTAIVLAARSAEISALDGVFPDFTDDDGFERECRWGRTLGFAGKWAIHPRQVDIANTVFRPSASALAEAREIVENMQDRDAQGEGAFALNGRMVDAAVVRTAMHTVALAEAIARRETNV